MMERASASPKSVPSSLFSRDSASFDGRNSAGRYPGRLTWSSDMVRSSTSAPMPDARQAASHPAMPAPTTSRSYAFSIYPFLPGPDGRIAPLAFRPG